VARDLQQGRRDPELSFVAFQATFAAITCALIVGAFAERMKFSAVLLFCALWFTFSYLPIAHMVWYWDGPDAITDAKTLEAVTAAGGWLWAKGALDFAAAPWCTSTPVSPAWWAPTWSASASATARNRSRRTA
jgi:Amt family ammonium transporter